MAAVFGAQNAGDSDCLSMALGFDGPAFKAASGLVFEGRAQPSAIESRCFIAGASK